MAMKLLIDYSAAERYCSRLARHLRTYLGPQVHEVPFIPIPRGGLFVLGMLSYFLDLRHSQILPCSIAEHKRVVVVDDCSISGARFAQFLQSIDAQRVVFVHLLSHPKLRSSILNTEERVEACLAAEDLVEREEGIDAGIYKHLSDTRYWRGDVEHFAFAWNQPRGLLWNESTLSIEDNWFNTSPHRCLGAWATLSIEVEKGCSHLFDVPPHVWWRISCDEEVLLWDTSTNLVYGLRGAANLMWRTLLACDDQEIAMRLLLEQYKVDESLLRRDLKLFINDMLSKGLLQREEADT